MDARARHPEKAFLPMVVIWLLIRTSISLSQPENAISPMTVILSGIKTLVTIDLLIAESSVSSTSLKAPPPMILTMRPSILEGMITVSVLPIYLVMIMSAQNRLLCRLRKLHICDGK